MKRSTRLIEVKAAVKLIVNIHSVFFALIMTAACFDVLTRKIPNPLNFTLLLSGVFASTLGWVSVEWADSLLGVFTAFGVLLLPFALRVYQGGDVKLCMGMGAWLGVKGMLWAIGLGVIGGGVLALLIRWKARGPSHKLTVPMAVSFALSGYVVYQWGAPPW
jgi:Flp pilus assembly protein protease CpaA